MNKSILDFKNNEYPRLEVDLDKIKNNVRVVLDICKKSGITPLAVVKVSNGASEIPQAVVDAGLNMIGDSRLRNLKNFKHIQAKKYLLRTPMMSEVNDLIEYVDVSLNSEIKVIRSIAKEAQKNNKTHEIILMVEVGDLREGIYEKTELLNIVEEVSLLKGIKLTGIGANFNCFGAIKPTSENLGKLISFKNEIKNKLEVDLEIISGGNSGSLALINKGEMPKEINQLRLGSAFLLGLIEINLPKINDTYSDAFKLTAEIIEVKEKPSKPYGESGLDSFRKKPIFFDKGIRKRAICAIGKQDCDPQFMYPKDKEIEVIGSSSDHVLLDVTECKNDYVVGDKVSFVLDYVAILRCMTSSHVRKVYN